MEIILAQNIRVGDVLIEEVGSPARRGYRVYRDPVTGVRNTRTMTYVKVVGLKTEAVYRNGDRVQVQRKRA